MDADTVELGWRNEEDIITGDSRVTITSNFSINAITAVIRFDPLFEDDEGIYTCYSVVQGLIKSTSIQLQNFRTSRLQSTIKISHNFNAHNVYHAKAMCVAYAIFSSVIQTNTVHPY